jgi:hypothetical protein
MHHYSGTVLITIGLSPDGRTNEEVLRESPDLFVALSHAAWPVQDGRAAVALRNKFSSDGVLGSSLSSSDCFARSGARRTDRNSSLLASGGMGIADVVSAQRPLAESVR